MDKRQTDDLKQCLNGRWIHLWYRVLGPNKCESFAPYLQEQFDLLTKHYSEAHRAYHTLAHLYYLFNMLDRYCNYGTNLDAIEIAAWFHDIIYDTKKKRDDPKSNELLSAEYAQRVMQHLEQEELHQTVVHRLIMVTQHKPGIAITRDEMLLADLDWSPLGWTWGAFAENGHMIRFEYSEFSDAEFRAGRLAFMRSALERMDSQGVVHPQFYLQPFKALYEKQARSNIERTISELEAGAIV